MILEGRKVEEAMVAPCGMNCALCVSHQRENRKCPGCRSVNKNKPAGCIHCAIKGCGKLRQGSCAGCEARCDRLESLDRRYRKNYGMSMIENLDFIRAHGTAAFLEREEARWRCPQCGEFLCVHREACFACGTKWK